MSSMNRIQAWLRTRKWRRSAGMTPSELAVVRALLPSADFRSEQLFLQAADAPVVERTLVGQQGYQAVITYVKNDSYLIDAERDFISPPLAIRDAVSGRQLTFTIKVIRGGFLRQLEGTVDDGKAWPSNWIVRTQDMGIAVAKRDNWLPPLVSDGDRRDVLVALERWAGIEPGVLAGFPADILSVRGLASESEIARAEDRLACTLPEQYREFTRICNGLSIRHGRPYEIFGTEDIYVCDSTGHGGPLVVVTNLYEKGVVVLDCGKNSNGTTRLLQGDMDAVPIGEFRTHVRDSLMWIGQTG